MPSIELAQAKENIEKIFRDVSDALEKLLIQYRQLLMDNDNDLMHESLFAFCDELEALRKKIIDPKQSVTDRIDAVKNIYKYTEDMIAEARELDIEDHQRTITNRFVQGVDFVENIIGMNAVSNLLDGDFYNQEQRIDQSVLTFTKDRNENYFIQKSAELDNIVENCPALKDS